MKCQGELPTTKTSLPFRLTTKNNTRAKGTEVWRYGIELHSPPRVLVVGDAADKNGAELLAVLFSVVEQARYSDGATPWSTVAGLTLISDGLYVSGWFASWSMRAASCETSLSAPVSLCAPSLRSKKDAHYECRTRDCGRRAMQPLAINIADS